MRIWRALRNGFTDILLSVMYLQVPTISLKLFCCRILLCCIHDLRKNVFKPETNYAATGIFYK